MDSFFSKIRDIKNVLVSYLHYCCIHSWKLIVFT